MSINLGSGKTQLYAIEKYGVENEVLNLYKDGVPATKISEILASKGKKVSPIAINRWLKNHKIENIDNKKIETFKKIETMVINYKDEITTILDEVKSLKQVAYNQALNGEWVGYDKLVGRLYQGIELLAKLMGDIRPAGSIDINIIINEINKKIFEDKKGLRHSLHNVVDVEAEIIEQDKERQDKLEGK